MDFSPEQRDAAFRQIEKAYQGFYDKLRVTGDLPYLRTNSGMWAVSEGWEVYSAFDYFHISQYGHFADLGSGDGKVVLIASLFTKATGYETDETLYNKSLEIRAQLNLTQARFLQDDYLQADLAPYDLLFLYPDKPFYDLEEKLRFTWSGRLLVNGPHFPPRHFGRIAESPAPVGRFVLYGSPSY
jgi:hypothetical protein